MSADVRVETLPAGAGPAPGPLAQALRTGEGAPSDLLPALPRGEAGWREALRGQAARLPRPPSGLVEALVARQEALGAGPAAVSAARALGEPDTLAVVTGQQPGLLGGPLLSFHKAAGALHLARRLDALGEGRVVACFWLASEDHDAAEADQATLLDRQGQPRRLSLGLEGDGRSLMDRDVPAETAAALLEEVRELLPDTPRAREAIDLLGLDEAGSFADRAARSLLRLLGDQGLVVLDPRDVLAHAGEALAELVLAAPAIAGAVGEAARGLEAAGLSAPVAMAEEDLPLFVRTEPGGPRRRLRRDGDRLHLVDGGASWTPEALADHLRETPSLGSGDVVGRVFVQDRLIPTLAYVAGPTEIVYHAQVRAAHEAVGVPYAFAVPRPRATWVDGKSRETAAAFDTTIAAILQAGPAPEAPASDDQDLERTLEAWEAHVAALPAEVEDLARGEGEGPRAVEQARRALAAEAARRIGRVRGAFAKDRGVGAARWSRLQALLLPRGRPQERVLSPLSLVARHGLEAWRTGLAALDPLAEGHHLVHLP